MDALGSALSFGIWQNWGLGTVAPPPARSGSRPEPASHVAHRLADARGSAGNGFAQALSDNGVSGWRQFLRGCLRESGWTSGALVVKAQEFAPLASPGAVHHVTFVVVYRHHFEKFFYTEKKR